MDGLQDELKCPLLNAHFKLVHHSGKRNSGSMADAAARTLVVSR